MWQRGGSPEVRGVINRHEKVVVLRVGMSLQVTVHVVAANQVTTQWEKSENNGGPQMNNTDMRYR